MKILHTSDWHIGHALYGKKRNGEHAAFLGWLAEQIISRDIDALIVSGDIFDTGSPGGAAEQLYFDFLTSIIKTNCKTVVIVSGNHDSPRRLEAPAALLKNLDIFVVGLPSEPENHVIELKERSGDIGALCCAVPYLRKNEMVRIGDEDISTDEKIYWRQSSFIAMLSRRQSTRTRLFQSSQRVICLRKAQLQARAMGRESFMLAVLDTWAQTFSQRR